MSVDRYTKIRGGTGSFEDRLARAMSQAEKEGNTQRRDVLRKILGMQGSTAAHSTGERPPPGEDPHQQRIDFDDDEQPQPEEPTSSGPEEGEMSDNNEQSEGKSAARSTLGVLARAGLHGTKVAAASAANKELVDLVEELLGEHYPDLMKTPMGRPVAELVAPLFLLQMTHMFPERFPKVEYVQAGGEFALEAVSRDSLEPLLRMVVPMSRKLAKVGAQFMSDSVEKVRSSGLPAIEERPEDADEVDDREIEELRARAEKYRAEAATKG